MTDTFPPPLDAGASDARVSARSAGTPFDLAYVRDARVDDAALEQSLRTLAERSRLPRLAECDRLAHALRAIDLTTLAGDDTAERVRALCARAREPLPVELAQALRAAPGEVRTASVCIYHHFLPVALESLAGTGIPVAVVAAGFPAGLSPLRQRIDEVAAAVAAGAGEIDAVINRSHALGGSGRRSMQRSGRSVTPAGRPF